MTTRTKTDDLLIQLTRQAEIARLRATGAIEDLTETIELGQHERVTEPNPAFHSTTAEMRPVSYARWIEACRTGQLPDGEFQS